MRKVRTASRAVAVQIVVKDGDQVVEVDHVGSAHTDQELALLLEAAKERLVPGQEALDLGPLPQQPVRTSDVADWTSPDQEAVPESGGRPPTVAAGGRVVSTSALILWQVLADAYSRLGFDVLGDDAFRALVLARTIEPTSKADAVRVLEETGVPGPSLRTIFRAMERANEHDYRDALATACLARSSATAAGQASLVLYDCTTLHFEAENEDEFRKVGMSKERRVDPQIQVGLLVDRAGFPLEAHTFEGNKAETKTLVPVLEDFQQRHGVTDMVVVADAGMLSASNLNALEDAGFGVIVG